MCWPHWRRVPKMLQRIIWEEARRLPDVSEEYWRARCEAIEAVRLKEIAEKGRN